MSEEHRSTRPAGKPENLPSAGSGAHEKAKGEDIHSRSADPGQSSYGGFSGEDPRRQAQELPKKDAATTDQKSSNAGRP
ncbi:MULTISPECIES: hypothetical protein [unclassified Achromobacter]|uniref:hypothetical protein n=1 Tax=unclassified Achromobacter TaxID=2626865 RepID=UPI000B51AFF8|nr:MULTISPECIES: hypothetical protein [unclassified Achromobacter]OWT74517.1 hypothetical protein CEY05_18075 [Achromobacter sp. HZ34]OWT78984.1 hypothetical protein CEY04_07995 [Achromobacter sp. HZ28]